MNFQKLIGGAREKLNAITHSASPICFFKVSRGNYGIRFALLEKPYLQGLDIRSFVVGVPEVGPEFVGDDLRLRV